MEASRHCNRCNTDRPLTDFYVSKGKVNPWCKPCYKDWYQKRGGYSTRREVVCGWCGQSFTTPYGKKAKFCSRQCKDLASNRKRQDAINDTKPERRCVWCGVDLPQTMRADAKFCSDRCNNKAHQANRKWRRRENQGTIRPRTEPLPSFIDIAERDRWKCGICGKAVNKQRKYPEPLAGSIDHLLPISQGGGHEMSNLQLAHFVCNWTKRDRAANDRLRLI